MGKKTLRLKHETGGKVCRNQMVITGLTLMCFTSPQHLATAKWGFAAGGNHNPNLLCFMAFLFGLSHFFPAVVPRVIHY